MPSLPDHAFTITGGCNCSAIRYKISVPALADRPPTHMKVPLFLSPEQAQKDWRLPTLAVCHCASCRRGFGSVVPAMAQCAAYMVSISALPVKSTEKAEDVGTGGFSALAPRESAVELDGERQAEFRPAAEVFKPGSASGDEETWVRFYHASGCMPDAARVFCGRCGVHFGKAYRITEELYGFMDKPAGGWDEVVNISMATMDDGWLQQEWMEPAVQAFGGMWGIPWVVRTVKMGEDEGQV
ncbi:hypothetical protein LY78DRAFT_657478 [Colletotrichum sublineola]|uniref:CENP-V/GFA domain-containing protein n=1 Tax=Colletotrichum sublineola TaxID=1173701 RepID=A0A066X3J7_COLSU|nr:hypothetical protein LY78DRAFT_657478 [Colletotrichum sublineola]KDN62239.1 hypothetical protein CSUB01_02468 [Colletotrichum sublineola]